ncbi:MAG: phosphoglycerate kinase [Dehalococcoidia bacterium]
MKRTIKTIKDIKVKGKRVLVRVDFNVPLDEQGRITSDTRIRATLPTIEYLLERGACIILCSHLGRPKGKPVEGLSLRVAAECLSKLLDQPVETAEGCIGPQVEQMAQQLGSGEALMLENVRFTSEELDNDDAFAQGLARLAEIYINDAFGACHRAHASIVGVPKHLPAGAGLLLEKELKTLGGLLENPEHPFGGLFGGAKVSDKVATLENIMDKLDFLLIGGAMAALFLKAKGYEIGQSEMELDELDTASTLIETVMGNETKLLLPVDLVVAESIDGNATMETVSVENIPSNMMIVDIGPQTVQNFQEKLRDCHTIFWNGPMGIYEIAPYATGTKSVANHLAALEATTVVAGGSTAEIVDDLRLTDRMGFVSTGGGAALKYLAGDSLPGVEALPEAEA